MVLIDPSFAHQQKDFGSIPGITKVLAQDVADLGPCMEVARTHHLPTKPSLVDLCLEHDPAYSPALMKVLDQMALSTDRWTDLTSELASFRLSPKGEEDIDSVELNHEGRSFGHLPLIVLTAGNSHSGFDVTAPQNAALNQMRIAAHDRIAALSSVGRNQIVPNSSHYIQFYQPQVVIAAIQEVVDEVHGHSKAGQD